MIVVTIGSVVYALVGLVAARLVAGHVAWKFAEGYRSSYARNREFEPDMSQWFGGWCLGLLAGVIWPVILGFTLLPTRHGHWVVGAEARAVRSAREAEIAARERHIAELERDLDR